MTFIADMEPYVRPLGRMVIVSGNMEHTAYQLAISLGVMDAPKHSVLEALKRARRQLDADPPPWSSLTVRDFDSWREQVRRALDQRNQLIHAAALRRPDVPSLDSWHPARLLLRDGTEVATTPDGIEKLIEDVETITANCPLRNVLPEVKTGVHYQPLRIPGYEAGLYVYYDGETGWPDTAPENDDVGHWWNSLPVETRLEWRAWTDRLIATAKSAAKPSAAQDRSNDAAT